VRRRYRGAVLPAIPEKTCLTGRSESAACRWRSSACWSKRPTWRPLSNLGWILLVYATVIQFCVAYVSWFAALARLPASVAAIGTMAVPVIGVVTAVALHEPLGIGPIAALIFTLGAGDPLLIHKREGRRTECAVLQIRDTGFGYGQGCRNPSKPR
jgi:EamA-like transporter family